MELGERIKETRKSKNISVEQMAKELGVSKTTVYRYEDSTITKIPVNVFDQICKILEVSPAQLMGNTPNNNKETLPQEFYNPQDAMEFILRTPTLAAFGGYDPNTMDDETILAFANDILQQLELVSHKYK